jgi:serpin B
LGTLLLGAGCIAEPTELTAPTPPFGIIDDDEDRFRSPAVPEEAFDRQIRANNRFATDLYATVAAEETGGNIALAPFAISLAAVQLHLGADGATADELAGGFRLELDRGDLYPTFNRLDRRFTDISGVVPRRGRVFTLETVDNRWLARGTVVKRAYRETLTRQFDAVTHILDFAGGPERAGRLVDDWVSGQSAGRLDGILTANQLDAETRLLVTNAALPTGSWRLPFDRGRTGSVDFRRPDGSTVETPLMRLDRREGIPTAEADDWRAVELPYLDEAFSLLVIVPDSDRFGAVEERLSPDWLDEVVDRLDERPVSLGLPRFDVGDRLDLRDLEQSFGLTTLFDPAAADFSRLTPDANVGVDDFVHRTRIRLDEDGTNTTNPVEEAAFDDLPDGAIELTVDRPFLFVLRHRTTGSLLVVGRLLRPTGPPT